MMNKRFRSLLALLAVALLSTVGSGCVGTRVAVGDAKPPVYRTKGGPPPWAPAHGYRAKHSYRYYPDQRVYHDTGRGLYFYYQNGNWEVSARLPSGIHLSMGEYVSLEMDSDKPYAYHTAVEAKYPPGKSKKKAKGYEKKKKW